MGFATTSTAGRLPHAPSARISGGISKIRRAVPHGSFCPCPSSRPTATSRKQTLGYGRRAGPSRRPLAPRPGRSVHEKRVVKGGGPSSPISRPPRQRTTPPCRPRALPVAGPSCSPFAHPRLRNPPAGRLSRERPTMRHGQFLTAAALHELERDHGSDTRTPPWFTVTSPLAAAA